MQSHSPLTRIIALNQVIYGQSKLTEGELDIVMPTAVVEVSGAECGKELQIEKYLRNPRFRAQKRVAKHRIVILFAPRYTKEAEALLPQGCLLVHDFTTLDRQLELLELAAMKADTTRSAQGL